jgi:dolichol-phosphate mannosyltransferase
MYPPQQEVSRSAAASAAGANETAAGPSDGAGGNEASDAAGASGPPRGSGGAAPLRVSALLPVYAERDTVPELVGALHRLIPDDLFEVVITLAPKAPPETRRICEETAARFPATRVSIQKRTPGLGWAVRQSIEEARGSHVLLMDSDGEMDVETVPRMVTALKELGADMVVGSRWMKGGGAEGYDRLKYFLNRGYQLIFRVLYRTRVHDLTLGFKLARADIMKAQPWDSEFHDIGCETTMRILRAGYRVAEVPTVWVKRKEGESNNTFLRNFKYVWKALAILVGPATRVERVERVEKA